jgi:hypothetical protein
MNPGQTHRRSSSSRPASHGLVYGGFSYTKEHDRCETRPLEVSAKEKQTVNVPNWWTGVGAIV